MKKRDLSTYILILVFLVGLVILVYPTVADWWNSKVQSGAIMNYDAAVAAIDKEDYTAEFEKADDYNARLNEITAPMINYEQVEGYNDILNVAGTGVIGYIEIPTIGVKLPIYHGTSVSVLNVAVGHLEGTSLPVGGESTHSVLSAHRGLPSAKLFTDLNKLTEGDEFYITVLDRLLTYEVDQIRIVEPHEVDELAVEEGKDYVTLLTCTPYGINTHRLLVRGHRVENAREEVKIVIRNEAFEVDSTMLAPLVAAPLLLILLIVMLIRHRTPKKEKTPKRHGKKKEKEDHE